MTNAVLVLDYTYLPVNVISNNKAISLVVTEKADVVEHSNKFLRSQYLKIPIPTVIRLKGFSGYKQFSKVNIKFNKLSVLQRDDFTCQYCGKLLSLHSATIDHVLPKSKGGRNNWKNCVACCKDCNYKKGNLTITEANMSLIRQPVEPSYTTVVHRIISKANKNDIWTKYLI